MAVMFVMYIPNEELSDHDETDASKNTTTGRETAGKSATAGISGDDDGGVENMADDVAVTEPLLGAGKPEMIGRMELGSQNQISSKNGDVVKNNGRRISSASLATVSLAGVGGEPKQSVVLKGDKVRFQVTTLSRNDLNIDGVLRTSIPEATATLISGDKAMAATDVTSDTVIERLTLKEALLEILDSMGIRNDVWELTEDESCWNLKFIVKESKSEQVLNKLIAFGFGRIPATSVSVFSSNVHYTKIEDDTSSTQKQKNTRSEFVKSIKSRLTVAQVVMAVQSNAMLTFDFLVLIGLASIIAALGLAENSSVVLVASMLISPLMGPIVGFTFGVEIENRALYKVSVRNELIGLSVCLGLGFLFGLITGGVNNPGAYWGSTDSWPTQEMQTRGMLRSLWVGILIALPSGAGVALSILGGNTGSLVGVAISASLLPPAVNAGLLWGLALVSAGSHPSYSDPPTVQSNSALNCTSLKNNNYQFIYSCDMSTEAAILGSVSLLLTVLNIICIFVAGIVVLKIKEIAPHTALNPQTEMFWKRDIPVMRNAYKTVKGSASLDFRNMAKQVLAGMQTSESSETSEETVKNALEMVKSDPAYMDIRHNLHSPQAMEILRQVSEEWEAKEKLNVELSVEPTVIDSEDGHYVTICDSGTRNRLLGRSNSFIVTPTAAVNSPHTVGSASGAVLRIRNRNAPVASPTENMLLVDVDKLGHHAARSHQRRSLQGFVFSSEHHTPTLKHEEPVIEQNEPVDDLKKN